MSELTPTQYRIPMDIAHLYERGGWWWVQFEGSGEALRLDPVKPNFQIGETVEVIIRKRS